jgi:hypothetical protein
MAERDLACAGRENEERTRDSEAERDPHLITKETAKDARRRSLKPSKGPTGHRAEYTS